MSLSMAFFTFLNAWWIMLFVVLPLNIEKNTDRTEVEYAAAPKSINWRRVLWTNTLLAAAVTGLLALVIHSGVIPLRDVLQ